MTTLAPPDDSWSPATAAVAAIGDAAGITDRRPGEPGPVLVERTGDVRWLCQAVVEHLQAAHRRNLGTARAADRTAAAAPTGERRPTLPTMSEDLSSGVAVRLSALCLDRRGRVSGRLLHSDAVRGGLFVDLALAGRIESEEDSIVLDERPTGFEPADRLLAAVASEPERSLDDWLGEQRLGLRDVAAANLASGRWRALRGLPWQRRRFADTVPATTAADLRPGWAAPVEGGSPQDAAVTALAMAAGLLDREHGWSSPPPESFVAATAPADWLSAVVVDHLRAAAVRYVAEASSMAPF